MMKKMMKEKIQDLDLCACK